MTRKKSFTLITLSMLLLFSLNFIHETSNAGAVDIFSNSYQGYLSPNEHIELNFISFQKRISLRSDIDLNFTVTCLNPILERQVSIEINNSLPIMLNITFNLEISDFLTSLPDLPVLEGKVLKSNYNNFIRVISNSTIANMTFYFEQHVLLGLDPLKNYSIAYFKPGVSTWQLLPSNIVEGNESSNPNLSGALTNILGEEEYYFTILSIENEQIGPVDNPFVLIMIGITILGVIVILGIIIAISKQEYFEFIKKRLTSIDKGYHRLSLDEVLENENRNKIIDLILKNPGIHFNEILRETNLSPGNLVWHLDILEAYKIISKKRIMNYVSYFPYYQKNPISNLELKLKKSDLTLKILKLVKKNPGTWNRLITETLSIDRKTIAYHISKLEELDLIKVEKDGRKKKIYPTEDLDDLVSEKI